MQQRDRAAAPRQPGGCHHPGVTAADDDHIDLGWE